jgi:uncharacterized membrane protein
MKAALSDDGEIIIAGTSMPEQANCPFCGGRVTLRRRRLMGGGITYFWRHIDYKQSKSCTKRAKPYKHYN